MTTFHVIALASQIALQEPSAKVAAPAQELCQQLATLETLLGRHVVANADCQRVIVWLETKLPLKAEEQSEFARLSLSASGLVLEDVGLAYLVRRAEETAKESTPELKSAVFRPAFLTKESIQAYLGQSTQTQRPAQEPKDKKASLALGAPASIPDIPKAQPLPIPQPSAQVAGVTIRHDESYSLLFLTGPAKAVDNLLQELALMDVPKQEVTIHAIIGELTCSDGKDLGVNWSAFARNAKGVDSAASQGGFATAAPTFQPLTLDTNTLAKSVGLTLYGHYGGSLAAAVSLLAKEDNFNILQRPSLTTELDREASIYIGQQVAIAGSTYAQGTVVGAAVASTTQFIPVRLQLKVTPHLLGNGKIRLEIDQTHNDISGFTTISGNPVPNISEQGITSVVTIEQGTTVLLGGLKSKSSTGAQQGVPYLRNLPVVGRLFKHEAQKAERHEVIVLLQADVVSDHKRTLEEQGKPLEMLQGSVNLTRQFLHE